MICASGVGFVAVLTMANGVLGVAGCWIRFKRLEFGGKGIVGWGACSVSRSGVARFWVGGRSKEAGGCKGVAVKERVRDGRMSIVGVVIGGGTGGSGYKVFGAVREDREVFH